MGMNQISFYMLLHIEIPNLNPKDCLYLATDVQWVYQCLGKIASQSYKDLQCRNLDAKVDALSDDLEEHFQELFLG